MPFDFHDGITIGGLLLATVALSQLAGIWWAALFAGGALFVLGLIILIKG